MSNRTIRRALNAHGYKFLQARKKGLLSKKDLMMRTKFARKVKKRLPESFWRDGVGFYLDGVGYAHKTNPFDQACAPRTRIWRKTGEGIQINCTSTGSKAGTGGKVANFIVAIA